MAFPDVKGDAHAEVYSKLIKGELDNDWDVRFSVGSNNSISYKK